MVLFVVLCNTIAALPLLALVLSSIPCFAIVLGRSTSFPLSALPADGRAKVSLSVPAISRDTKALFLRIIRNIL